MALSVDLKRFNLRRGRKKK